MIIGTAPLTSTAEEKPLADTLFQLIKQGDAFFQQGYFQQATKQWEKSLALCPENTSQHIDVLSRLAAAYQNFGLHRDVFLMLDKAISIAEQRQDAMRSAIILSQLSDAWLSIGDAQEALLLAENSIVDAKNAKAQKVLAMALNSQGNAFFILHSRFKFFYRKNLNLEYFPESIKAYNESAQLAEKVCEFGLAV